jgi:hypothetical protein
MHPVSSVIRRRAVIFSITSGAVISSLLAGPDYRPAAGTTFSIIQPPPAGQRRFIKIEI